MFGSVKKGRMPSAGAHRNPPPSMGLSGLGGIIGGAINIHTSISKSEKKEVGVIVSCTYLLSQTMID